MVKVPVLGQSCFCISLSRGGLVLGWLGVLASISGLITTIIYMSIGVDSLINNSLTPDKKSVSESSKKNKLYSILKEN